jgi:hypothetical protein
LNDKIISDAVNNGDVGAIFSIDSFGQEVTNFRLSGIEIELISVSKTLIKFLIRGNAESGKVVILDIHKDYEFKLDNSDSVMVNFNDNPLQHGSFSSVLSAEGDTAQYCISLGNDGIKILIYIPHFSEHTVTIEKVQNNAGKPSSGNIPWSSVAILMIGIILIICILAIIQLIRKKNMFKKSEELSINDDDPYDDYETISSNNGFANFPEQKEYPLKDIYFNGYDEQNTKNTYKQEPDYGSERHNKKAKPVRRPIASYSTSQRMKKVTSHSHDIQLGALRSELIRKRGTKDLSYSRSELLSLLEEKFQLGKVSKKTYLSLKNDIECLEN